MNTENKSRSYQSTKKAEGLYSSQECLVKNNGRRMGLMELTNESNSGKLKSTLV